MLVLGIVGSPTPSGRTLTAVRAVLDGAASTGATTNVVELASGAPPDEVAEQMAGADAVVLGSPVYRARATAALRGLLESTQRGMWGETTAPLQGTACALVLTGASLHHFLAVDELRAVLASFFAAQVLSPGLYLQHADFADRETLGESAAELAHSHGAALVDLAAAIGASSRLSALRPLA